MNDDTHLPPVGGPSEEPRDPRETQDARHPQDLQDMQDWTGRTAPLPAHDPYANPYQSGYPAPSPSWDDAATPGPVYQQPYHPPRGGPLGPPPPYPGTSYGSGSGGSGTALATRPVARGRRGFAAGVIAAALIVGGGAGVGGAAVYSSQHDTTTATSSSFATSTVSTDPAPASSDGSVEQVASTVLPSVVKLDVSGAQEAGSGSGIILSADGLILTNNHVAAVAGNGGKITVSFNDGSHAPATIVGTDPLTDTALVQATGVSGLTPATIGQSGKLAVGQPVVAIGSPFGLSATVTSGIVSALDRPVNVGTDAQGNSTTYPAIQTDAAINPGNSGGPLVDMNGHVVGIDASIQSTGSSTSSGESGSIGLGFAIPIDEVLPVIEQMKNGETPTHAKLGVSVKDATDDSGAQITDGATIEDVNNGSAASDAGLQNGDVITKLDDHLIDSSDSLVATIRAYRPGDQVTVTYERDGQTKTTQLALGSDADSSNS